MERKERINLDYENNSKRFLLTPSDFENGRTKFFERQFLYFCRARLNSLNGRIMANARRILGEVIETTDLANCASGNNVFVIGAIIKKMVFRQSILYEFSDDTNLHLEMKQKLDENICNEGDVLHLEDSQQIVKLSGEIDKHCFVTGDIVGVFGSQKDASDFFVVKMVIYPEIRNQLEWPLIEDDCYIAFISGISMASKGSLKTKMALMQFQRWINGEMAASEEESELLRRIGRLVIAGDSILFNPIELDHQQISVIGEQSEVDLDCFGQFDDKFLSRLLHNIRIDLMPGANDPVQCMIPQQPVPKALFNSAIKFGPMLNTVPNPYCFQLNGLEFFGTSGQNISHLRRVLRCEDGTFGLMERTLRMGCAFPTVPDTLAGFPFADREPLIFERTPHVYFVGNQPSFEHKIIHLDDQKKCFLLTIPKFNATHSIVLMNLRTFHCKEYTFDINLDVSRNGEETNGH